MAAHRTPIANSLYTARTCIVLGRFTFVFSDPRKSLISLAYFPDRKSKVSEGLLEAERKVVDQPNVIEILRRHRHFERVKRWQLAFFGQGHAVCVVEHKPIVFAPPNALNGIVPNIAAQHAHALFANVMPVLVLASDLLRQAALGKRRAPCADSFRQAVGRWKGSW